MNRIATLVGGTLLVGFSALGFSSPSAPLPPGTKTVKVHCRNGNNAPFVTPRQARLSVGDTLLWTGDGTVLPDSITITLKPNQPAWPFQGSAPSGGGTVTTGGATTKGTVQYNATVKCRVPGGGQQWETIDPDIIID